MEVTSVFFSVARIMPTPVNKLAALVWKFMGCVVHGGRLWPTGTDHYTSPTINFNEP